MLICLYLFYLFIFICFFVGKKVSATSLQTVVSWYQGHCQSCQHEPELRAVEPTVGLSTSALWQCVAGHSFVQNLPCPAGGESESDVEDSVMEKDEEDRPPEKKATVNESINTKRRKLQTHGQLQGMKTHTYIFTVLWWWLMFAWHANIVIIVN